MRSVVVGQTSTSQPNEKQSSSPSTEAAATITVDACDAQLFDSDGTVEAIQRLMDWVKRLPAEMFPMGQRLMRLPSWIGYTSLELACCYAQTNTDREMAWVWVREMRVARLQLDNIAEGKPLALGCPEQLQLRAVGVDILDGIGAIGNDPRAVVAIVRLVFGELAEAAARVQALSLAGPDDLPLASEAREAAKLSRVWFDSYRAAVWTSAHCEYLMTLCELIELMPSGSSSFDVQPPEPSPLLLSFAIYSLPELSMLLDHRYVASVKAGVTKHVAGMSQLLWRSTNAGSRGWDGTLNDACKDSEGIVRVCRLALLSAITGMHPLIHPASRPSWETRAKIGRVSMALADSRKFVCVCPNAMKEAMRLFTACLLGQSPALREALVASGHPLGALDMSPFSLPHPSMAAAMVTLVDTGVAILRTSQVDEVFDILANAFVDDQRCSRRVAGQKLACAGSDGASASAVEMQPVIYSANWLGRGAPTSWRPPSLCDEVSAFAFSAFKADFVPLWLKAWNAGTRLTRVDAAQHKTLLKRNPIPQLVGMIPDERRLLIQRLALRTPNAQILCLSVVSELLGHPPAAPPVRGRSSLASVEDPEIAAELLHFAKVATLTANVMVWDLGEHTREMQLRALRRRLVLDLPESASLEEIRSRLPLPSCNVLACVECKRVANACCDHLAKNLGFTEIGLSSSMLRVDGEVCDGHMRCAKRSSAALRTALLVEQEAKAAMTGAPKATSSALVSYDHAAMVTKLRRDSKSVFEQTGSAIACGEQPLIKIPVIGYVVRLFNAFYSLCTICGCLCAVSPVSRHGGEICCLHCDAEMLSKSDKQALAEYRAKTEKARVQRKCRFCGKPDTSKSNSSKWKVISAPLDCNGTNREVPYPLRQVVYCPSHWKPWLPAAHRSLTTEAIFSHLTQKAKPIAGAEKGNRGLDDDVANLARLNDESRPGRPRKQRRVQSIRRKVAVAN